MKYTPKIIKITLMSKTKDWQLDVNIFIHKKRNPANHFLSLICSLFTLYLQYSRVWIILWLINNWTLLQFEHLRSSHWFLVLVLYFNLIVFFFFEWYFNLIVSNIIIMGLLDHVKYLFSEKTIGSIACYYICGDMKLEMNSTDLKNVIV